MKDLVLVKRLFWPGLLLLIGLIFSFMAFADSGAYAQGIPLATPNAEPEVSQPTQIEVVNPHYSIEHKTLADGTSLTRHIINGAPQPSSLLDERPASVLLPSATTVLLPNFPSYNWVFGCSAVSSAMIAGYYDRGAYPNMYTGPTNGGVMPVSDTSWPTWSDGYDTYPNNPLIASHLGIDGLATRGSIDDYWVRYDSSIQDPYITGGWVQHNWGAAIGDYMKTSQSSYNNVDGATSFYTKNSNEKLYCAELENYDVDDEDGTYGRKLFYEARGYTVSECYNQNTDNKFVGGFSLTNFKAEIDAGHPVMLNLNGHTVVGYGYDGTTIYIRNTWDNDPSHIYSMPWGGYYESMQLIAVSIVRLNPSFVPPDFQSFLPVIVKREAANLNPTDISLSQSSIMENQPVNTLVGILTTTDPNLGDTFTYSLVNGAGDTDNASFNISADQLRSSQVFDYETKNSYSVRMRSTDQGGKYIEKVFLITVTNVVEGTIVNGDFELGPTVWTEYSSHGWDIIMLSSEIEGLNAHSGSWLAYLAGGNDETSYISQMVTVPEGISYLHYWYWIESLDFCGYDYFRVKIGATTVRTQNLCDTTSTGGWVHTSINLSSYVNIPLTLKFEAITDSSNVSLIFLDDIYLASTATVSPDSFVPSPVELDLKSKEDW